MNKLTQLARRAMKEVNQNSPSILTFTAVAGLLGTVVLAVRATPKAVMKMVEMDTDAFDNSGGDLNTEFPTKWEYVKGVWTFYIPAATVGVGTIVCIVGGNAINTKRNAALIGLYSLTDKAFKEYQNKVVEQIGANKERNVRDDVAKDRVSNASTEGNPVIIAGAGKKLCMDALSGRPFLSDVETIRKAQNDLNQRILNGEGYVSLNDLYAEIGLERNDIGELIGWNSDALIDIYFGSHLTSENDPCIYIEFRKAPSANYYKLSR